MGRAILLIVLLSGIIFSLTSRQMNLTNSASNKNAAENFEAIQARNVAKSGIDLCVMQLDSNRNWRTGYSNFTVSGGTLSARVSTITQEYVQIVSSGKYHEKTVAIVCTVRIPPSNLPTAFDYALAADGPLSLVGIVNVLMENPSQQANASIHSNHSIYTGTQVNVAGFGTSTGSITCNPLSALPNVFNPNWNPNGLPDYTANTAAVPIPDLEVDQYKSIADEVYEGNLSLSGNVQKGALGEPRVIWVGGDLTLSGGVHFLGSGILIVKGSVKIDGDVKVNDGSGVTSALAIYSQNSITISGNPSIEGQFYAKQEFVVDGNATITGNAIVKNNQITITTLNGSATIRYRSANSLLTDPIWSTNPRPRMVSYWE